MNVKVVSKYAKSIRKKGINVNPKKSYLLVGKVEDEEFGFLCEIYLAKYDVTALIPIKFIKFPQGSRLAELNELYQAF